MSAPYTGWSARHYNRIWRRYEERTLTHAVAMIDFAALCDTPNAPDAPDAHAAHLTRRYPVRVLDAACGTGVLLRLLLMGCCLKRVPEVEAYGIDASADMLAEARATLHDWPNVRFERAVLGAGLAANLPYAPGTFDLITCTNALHYLPDPVVALTGLGRLLARGGQLVIEDYARRETPFPWWLFEQIVRRIDLGHVRAYTMQEARALCAAAGLYVIDAEAFRVDWLWRGWAIRACAVQPQQEPSAT